MKSIPNLAWVLSLIFLFVACGYVCFAPEKVSLVVYFCFLSLFNYGTYICSVIRKNSH